MINGRKTRNIRYLVFLLCFLVLVPISAFPETGIRATKHNLSGSLSKWPGNYTVKALDEPQICIFCHTPHNASPEYPLWNHVASAVTNYIPYTSNTLQSYDSAGSAPSVDHISKLCLSCHDGTVGVGSVNTRYEDIIMQGSQCVDSSGKLVSGAGCTGYIGTDLSGGHPISIIFDDNLASRRNNHIPILSNLNYPSTIQDPDVKLYPTHGGMGVQCTSCHDPHTNKSTQEQDGKQWPPFWRKPSYDEVCLVCHQQIPPDSNIQW